MDKNKLIINLLTAGFELIQCSDYNELVFRKEDKTEHFSCRKTVCLNMTSGVFRSKKCINGNDQPDFDICTNIRDLACSESGEVLTDIIKGKEFVL